MSDFETSDTEEFTTLDELMVALPENPEVAEQMEHLCKLKDMQLRAIIAKEGDTSRAQAAKILLWKSQKSHLIGGQ